MLDRSDIQEYLLMQKQVSDDSAATPKRQDDSESTGSKRRSVALGGMKLIEMASRSSKQSRSKDAEKEPLSFAERFEAIHKASQESGSDRHSVTIVNTNGRKLKSVKNGKKDREK